MNSAPDIADPPRSLLILTRALAIGGAERQIINLAKGLDRAGWRVGIAVFYRGGALESELGETTIQLIDLDKSGRWDLLKFSSNLVRSVRNFRPGTLYTFLGGANFIAALLRPLFPRLKLIWGVRASDMDHSLYGAVARLLHYAEAKLSNQPDLVISNSQAGARHAIAQGFPAAKIRCVANGIDTDRFRPDAAARTALRAEWEIAEDETLVGLVARIDPMKGHAIFLEAAALLAREFARLRFICVGDGPPDLIAQLQATETTRRLGKRMVWAGASRQPQDVFNALDALCSSSIYGEGFSNSVAEAMACGVPCVVTDVGDSAMIVGSTGEVAPAGSAKELAQAIGSLLPRLGPSLAASARARIVDEFSLTAMINRTALLCD